MIFNRDVEIVEEIFRFMSEEPILSNWNYGLNIEIYI